MSAPAADAPATTTVLNVSAAASLTDVLKEILVTFRKENPNYDVRVNLGASGVLVKQIESSAPVDIFFSAGIEEIDELDRHGLIDQSTRASFATNRLVLVAPPGSKIKDWNDLKLPAVNRIAIANPETTPSGRAARATLTKRGLWNSVQKKVVLAQNVRQTLAYVSSGDVAAGTVFQTDALAAGAKVVKIAEATPKLDHPPIVYQVAAIKPGKNSKGAHDLAAFMASSEAHSVLAKFGFGPAPK